MHDYASALLPTSEGGRVAVAPQVIFNEFDGSIDLSVTSPAPIVQTAKGICGDEDNASGTPAGSTSAGKTLIGEIVTSAFGGLRNLTRRFMNFVRGKKNRPASQDRRDPLEQSVKNAGDVGVQMAAVGTATIAIEGGWTDALEHTPVGTIMSVVKMLMEVVKVVMGRSSPAQAVDALAKCSTSTIGGLAGAAQGAAIGAVCGPMGVFIGGIIGSLGGSKIFEALYEFGKVIAKTVATNLKSKFQWAMETVKVAMADDVLAKRRANILGGLSGIVQGAVACAAGGPIGMFIGGLIGWATWSARSVRAT